MAFKAAEYQRYSGPRSKMPAWVPLAGLALSRGWKSKWVRRITSLSLMLGVGMMIMMYTMNQILPGWRDLTEQVGAIAGGDSGDWEIDARVYLKLLKLFVYPVLLPLSLLFGYDLISKDIETNALDAYFSRPISPLSYILGRSVAFVGFLMAATFGPMMLVWVSDWATSSDAHFSQIAIVPFGMFWSLLLISVTLSLLVQAITTITRSGLWTNISFVFIFIVLSILANIIFAITMNPNALALSILHNTGVVCEYALNEMPTKKALPSAPANVSILVMLTTSLVSFLIVYRGLKRRTFLG
ncbi:ABC transporter permease [Planctomycetota bacterium]|nr:ABC transporter permease [Planctomycetota bacterium]